MNRATSIAIAAGAAAAVGAAGLVTAPWYFQPRTLTRTLQRTWPGIRFDVRTDEPVFALTFDDGPHPPYTDRVLDTLAEHGAPATFFVMGEQVERHPAVFRRIVEEGHEVGNHFYDGSPTLWSSNQSMADSLRRTEEIIRPHNPARIVRPAGGLSRPSSREILRDLGYTVVLGSAYTSDCTNPPRTYMRWAFSQMLEPGRIVILHDGRKDRQRTVDVLPHILSEARTLGLQPVRVSELLAYDTRPDRFTLPTG